MSPTAAEVKMESRTIKPGLRWLNYLVLIPLMVLATVIFGCFSLLTSIWDRSGRRQHGIARVWAGVLLRVSLSPVEIVGLDHIPQPRTAVYVANHLSYMDTPVLYAKLPFQFRILAKSGLWKVPFIGWHLHRSGQVPVDQSSARSSIMSLNGGVAALKAGLPLVLFPEGGRSATGQTRSFLSGGAFMAIRAQVPLVPVTVIGTYELLPIHVYHLRPRPVLVVIGEPIATEGMTTREADALTRRAYDAITRTYMEYSGTEFSGPAGE